MNLYAINYVYATDPERMAEHRPAHQAYLGELYAAGHIVSSGRVHSAAGVGALLVMQAEDEAAIVEMLDQDVLWGQGLIAERAIARWELVWGDLGLGKAE